MKTISFKRGEPIHLRAKVGFNCGDLERQVNKGDDVWFDGYTVDFGDGVPQLYPKLKSAIKASWLGLAEDVPVEMIQAQEEASPFRMTVVDHEEEVVGKVMDPKKVVADNAKAFFEGREDLLQQQPQQKIQSLVAEGAVHAAAADSVEDFFHPNSQSPKPAETKSHTASPLHMPIISDEPEGVVIGSVDQFKQATQVSALTDDQREAMLVEALGSESDAVKAVQESRRVKEAAKAAGTSASAVGAEARRAARKAEAAAAQETVEAEEAVEAGEGAAASKIVNIGPGVQWDMNRPWATRAKNAVETYGEFPGLIKGILAVESEAVAKRIKKALEIE